MAVPNQATPTIQANLGGASTNVNLRDWLNTRLSPFLKKAIIESLDSEAEFPLQWLGEHLIKQSILFEGNTDPTNIQERFRYNHEIAIRAPSAATVQSAPPSTEDTHMMQQEQSATSQSAQQGKMDGSTDEAPTADQPKSADLTAPLEVEPSTSQAQESQTVADPTVHAPNGTVHSTENEAQVDTEMSNAT